MTLTLLGTLLLLAQPAVLGPRSTAASAAAVSAAAVDVADEADLHFSLGTRRFLAHDYTSALEHFLASNRLVPNRNVVFDIADCYAQLKSYPDAYRYYLQALEGETDANERTRILRAITKAAASVAVLRLRTEPPGATLYIDRKDLGARGLSPRVLAFPAGNYRVLAELDGYQPASSSEITATVGSDNEVVLKLERIVRPVKILGAPAGAEVKADTGESCALPCELQLPVGVATLTASAPGYVKVKQDLRVHESGNEPLELELRAQTGRLVVNTDERGATVQIDGRLAGFTPAVLDVQVGARTIRITLPGFTPVERTVRVERGEQPPLEVQLSAIDEISAASRSAESVDDAPSSVSVISGRELRAMGYPTLEEALRGLRGVFVNDDATYSSLGFRGYGPAGAYGNKVLILVDGHATNDDWAGSSYAGYDQRTDLDDLERIEVVRGPGSVLYGTGAFVGVVNLVTRPHEGEREASVTLATPETGGARMRASAHQPIGETSGFDLSLSGLSLGRRDATFGPLADGSYGFLRQSDGLDSGTVAGKAWLGPVSLQGQAVARDRRYPIPEDYVIATPLGSHVIDRRAYLEARYEPKFGPNGESGGLMLLGSFDRYSEDSIFIGAPGTNSHLRFIGDWVSGEARLTLRPAKSLRLLLGGEVHDHFHVSQSGISGIDTDSPQVYLGSENPFQSYAAYLLADWMVTPRLHLSAGARLDSYSTFGSSVNPRLAVIFKPTESDVLKLMAGSAFRAPSIYELYYNDNGATQVAACDVPSGCTALKPESILSGELELTHHFASLWTAVASGWASRIRDTISLSHAQGQPDGISKYQNAASPIQAFGGEVELRREWRQGWMASVSGSIQRLSFAQDANSSVLRELPNAPALQGAAKLAVPLWPRLLSLMTRVSLEGSRYDRNTRASDPPQGQTRAGVIWDLSLSGEVPEWHLRGTLGLYNLADWKYELPLSPEFGAQIAMPQLGRRAVGSITVSL